MKKKILMVCLGNICRSPLAEGILRKKAAERGIDVEIDSAGTSNYHIGENPDKRSCANASSHGVDISKLQARQFLPEDFDKFDHILVMDSMNYSEVERQARNEKDMKKVDFILNFARPGKNMAVPDPYFGGEEGFETVYNLLDEACDKICDMLESEN